jgi:two-component system, NtrC family, nitrogen regulation sensor histidine kinase NtrY
MGVHPSARSDTWLRLNRLRKQRRFQTWATFGLVILGPLLAIATFLALGPFNQGASSPALRIVLLADLIYILTVASSCLRAWRRW